MISLMVGVGDIHCAVAQGTGAVLSSTPLPTLVIFHGALSDSYVEGAAVKRGTSIETVVVTVHANILNCCKCEYKHTGIKNRCAHHSSKESQG